MLYKKPVVKFIARVMLCTLTAELVFPAVSSALTSGPSQPEVQSFEPVGTTDMVDMFTGDFVYNIPLLDVEGYPVNISYHSGGDMEQEASWVGLGWNINPGVVNRSVRGLPDDFNGEIIGKTLNMKPEKNVRIGLAGGAELAGLGNPYINIYANLGTNVNVSNYRGVSVDFGLSASIGAMGMSAGLNMAVSSQNGADVDYNLGISFSSAMIASTDVGGGVGVNFSHGYNTRSGLKDKTFGVSANVSLGGKSIAAPSYSATIPIGIKNIVPVITNSTEMKMYRGQIKLGGEVFSAYIHGAVLGMVSTLKYATDGSMKSYGYLYAQNADDASIMDFTRDRDGMFNETMSFLPPGNMTYDIYSVSGQGTGGSFRPYRNDFGSVYDPAVSSTGSEFGLNFEAGLGELFEFGTDITTSSSDITSGPWNTYKRPFTSKEVGSIYENTYFKQAGEVTEVNEGLWDALGGTQPVPGAQTTGMPLKKPDSDMKRDARGNLISYFTGDEATRYGVASSTGLYSYDSENGFAAGADVTKTAIQRVDNSSRKGYHISEIVQTQTDGRRYIYGLPAINNSQEEVTFATSPSNDISGLVSYSDQDASTGNKQGIDHYYSKTSTPSFAHSYLLTSVLSTDYTDITGDGPTDDDFGSFTKLNYTRKNASYGWKAPYGDHLAQYNPGFKSDTKDDKASFLQGNREQWMLHSIETKNFVAEFYASTRADARGADTTSDLSYKLDSIKLYNKHDRFINTTAAVPIKTIILQYDYSLCQGVANNANFIRTHAYNNTTGKLTLKKIFIRYGNSDRSMISPYQFDYGHNYDYSFADKDRWGMYKPNANPANADFPFVNQNDPAINNYAGAWSLETITLPSGGNIQVNYEADDYAYVQDRPAMEMFLLKGIGNSTNFSGGNQLYFNKDNPCRYFYFDRRTADEKPGISFRDNYLKGQDIIYYNMNTLLVDNKYEPIKGYAEVEEVGICPDNVHGYIKTRPVSIKGGGASLNHVTYTAINFGRYYLPHVIFPGSDPDEGTLENVLSGIQYAFTELVSIAKNPVKRMVQEGKAKDVKLASSFIRLNSPGLKKKGGGQRVKQLAFFDNWSKLAGGNSQDASYGKNYEYTTEDQGSYGTISSGVASYEPQIGGDENPFREPVNYTVQGGSNFPPNDPVGVYQELPIGESLYPAPVVGYSRVTVKSIHQEEGRSSQGVDIYDFYTARDFPTEAKATQLQVLANEDKKGLFGQTRIYEGTQGYTLVMNDMHGKPKRTEHRIIKPSTGATELVSYQQYNYYTEGNKLKNKIPVIALDPLTHTLHKEEKQVGVEADITIDTREKKEHTASNTWFISVNVFIIGVVPFVVGIPYPWDFNFRNEFRTAVATKVVQQYGILKEVQSYQEGAVTTVRNEAFDPVTGQALITSVNNEFNDKEYTVNYPAYWGYKSMGPSYVNTGYEQHFPLVSVLDYAARLPGVSAANFKLGDELLFTYKDGGVTKQSNAWVTGMYISDTMPRTQIKCGYPWCTGMTVPPGNITDTVDVNASLFEFENSEYICGYSANRDWGSCGNLTLIVKPRYKASWPQNSNFTDVHVKVVRSGAKNQLNESIQSYTAMDAPFDDHDNLRYNLTGLINITAKEFSDTLTAILPRFDSLINPSGWDSLNIYVNGTRQVKRVSKEYAYQKNRDYNTANRKAGLFSALSLWRPGNVTDNCSTRDKYCIVDTGFNEGTYHWGGQYNVPLLALHYLAYYPPAYISDYNNMTPQPGADPNWIVARSVTKWSPWGFELENRDAIGNYTAAMYGYNQQLPVALAQNARQHETFSDGFEDYQLLKLMSSLASMSFSPFGNFFNLNAISADYGKLAIGTSSYGVTVTDSAAHTGLYTLSTGNTSSLLLKVKDTVVLAGQPRYIPFTLQNDKQYIVSYWFRPKGGQGSLNNYSAVSGMQLKSNIIEGWQQAEGIITLQPSDTAYTLMLPKNAFVDDIRILPMDANMKAFVYHPVNQRLIATLDENNFASMYEYDQEGNLVRTKKETEKGIITVMESRSANVKKSN